MDEKTNGLVWSEVRSQYGKTYFYDHVEAETPLGAIRIEWKSWKEYDSFCTQMPNGEMVLSDVRDGLDAAKAAVQSAWDAMIEGALLLSSDRGTKWKARMFEDLVKMAALKENTP